MRIVIIGSSAASKSAVETLQRSGVDDIDLIIITKDKTPYYSRVILPNYLAGYLTEEELIFYRIQSSKGKTPEIIHGVVTGVVPTDKKVLLADGRQIGYDRLLICSGASPSVMLPERSPGETIRGVCHFRNIEDIYQISDLLQDTKDCVVAGGGLIGLKGAVALNHLGKHVTVVHRSSQLLSTFMDRQGSDMVYRILNNQGIDFILSDTIEGYETKEERLSGIALKSGNKLDAQLAVWAAGVSPNTDFLKNSGIEIDNGICIDDYMETNIEGIFAAGDVTRAKNLLTDEPDTITLWTDATLQGKVAAWNVLGVKKRYIGGLTMNSVVFDGVPFISMGIIRDADIINDQVFTFFEQERSVYRKIVLRDDRIIGAVFAGDIRYAGMVNWDLKSKRKIKNGKRYVSLSGLEDVFREHHAELMSQHDLTDANKED
ncbi:MAG: FAD-dependent oxidoreductase [Eubacteriales bacterium]|nr:FAD-dependent oxidoreductase [Eubacteriales bacterium]